MNEDFKLVWSDEEGDLRKKKDAPQKAKPVIDVEVLLKLRRLTSGKGRTVIEISNLPKNEEWCKNFSRELKSKLGIGGTYKNDVIEIHGENFDRIIKYLDGKSLKWKKVGG